jgi:hypothetical protein
LSAYVRAAHLLDGDVNAAPVLRFLFTAMAVAFKGLLRCLQFGLVAVRAQQAARKNVNLLHFHGISSSLQARVRCRRSMRE